MFQAAGWVLIITIISAIPNMQAAPAINTQIEGFKTEESCLKAAEKAKQDIKV